MRQPCNDLFSIYSEICSSSRVITISIGVYFSKNYKRYKRIKDLPHFFTKQIDSIISNKPKASCLHHKAASFIYLYSNNEEENYEVYNDICTWLAKLQATLKTIGFSIGIDRRIIIDANYITLSEHMSYFRMFKNMHHAVKQSYVIMDRSISFVEEIKKLLDKVIEYNNYYLQARDVVEISQCLDLLINRHMVGYGDVVVGE